MGRSIQFFAAIIVILSLANITSAETDTYLNISNSPPQFLQDIPDILIILDTPRINAFDLDDYFEDYNGDAMIFTHTPLTSVTITINSENQVSFYPDANYSGIQGMQFTASDLVTSAVSNVFQVTVGLDTIPPQWSSPKKNLVSVYQNYHVTFTAEWTDNTELKEYIFSINQGSGWVNQTVQYFTGKANQSTFKVQISASSNTEVSWTFYAKDFYDNMNMVDIQTFTVKEFTFEPGEEYDGPEYDGPEMEGGEDARDGEFSTGTGDIKLDYFKEGVLAENLEIDIRSLKVSMKQGANMTRVVQIINTGTVSVKLNASLLSMDLFARLSAKDFEIAPGETYELLIEFTIPEKTIPDQYFGFLLLNYGEKIYIPIVLDVKNFLSDLRINVNLTESSKAVKIGDKVTALITIKNIQDIKNSPSQFYYAIKNFRGDIISSAGEEIIIPSFFEEERTLEVPEGTLDGDYIFYARVISEDSIDLDSAKFLIGTRFKIIAILKKFFYPVVILILLLILFLLYLVYKRNKKKKRLLELYLLLNELRGLVKEGKSKEAMDVYKRIKITYGQHVSKDFMEDETKLKEELDKFAKVLTKIKEKPSPKPSDNKTKKPKEGEEKKPEEKPKEETRPAPTKPTTPAKPAAPTKPKEETKPAAPTK